LFYAAQTRSGGFQTAEESFQTLTHETKRRSFVATEFVLFVNDPSLMNETYRRYLETRIRKAEPYPGLPIILRLRPRTRDAARR
jgi:predicted GTPase